MGIDLLAAAWRTPDLSVGERMVLMTLADCADGDGICRASTAFLARRSGVGKRSIQRHVRALANKGLVVLSANARFDGSQTANAYTLNVAKKQRGSGKTHPPVPKCHPKSMNKNMKNMKDSGDWTIVDAVEVCSRLLEGGK